MVGGSRASGSLGREKPCCNFASSTVGGSRVSGSLGREKPCCNFTSTVGGSRARGSLGREEKRGEVLTTVLVSVL